MSANIDGSESSKKKIYDNIDPLTGDRNGRTYSQKLADKVAGAIGSWSALIIKCVVFVAWILLNSVWLLNRGFDPYPYILLNLALSVGALLENSVILLSQERAAQRDRDLARFDHDLAVRNEEDVEQILNHILQILSKLDEKNSSMTE